MSLQSQPDKKSPLHWPTAIGLGLVGTTVYQAFFIYGINRTLAGNASLMLATAPIITTLGEVPTPLQAVGAGGVIAGSLLVRAGKIEPRKPGESGR